MQADIRYSFTAQFLRGAAIFANRAHAIEESDVPITEELNAEHRACVVATVTQATAALESEISEVLMHGPGHHLGSDKTDAAGRDFLSPLAEVVDRQQTLHRYNLVLHLLRKPRIDLGAEPYQSADLLVGLRNDLIHYRSEWGSSMDSKKLLAALRQLRFAKPPFVSMNTNFFPHRCLSASLASWTVTTTARFIDSFYGKLGIVSPLTPYTAQLRVPRPHKAAPNSSG